METPDLAPLFRLPKYQRDYLEDTSRFKIGLFARQTGKSFIGALEITVDSLTAEAMRTPTHWLILSRGERQAKEMMEREVIPMLKASRILYDYSAGEKSDDKINKLEVRLQHGSRITALPSNPDTARGYSANMYLDEFAHHQNDDLLWRAVFPIVSRDGKKMRVISTPNGRGNKFYSLCTDPDSGFSLHKCDIDRAERESRAVGITSIDAEALKAHAGSQVTIDQELMCIFVEGISSWMEHALVHSCEDETAGKPPKIRDTNDTYYFGIDIARRHDLFVVVCLQKVGDVFWLREMICKRNIPFTEQESVVSRLVAKYAPVRIAVDQTGMGEQPTERYKDMFGQMVVEGILLTSDTRLNAATALKQSFQDKKIRIPPDRLLRDDLLSIKAKQGETGAVRLVAVDSPEVDGHADRFWALALAVFVAGRGSGILDSFLSGSGKKRGIFGGGISRRQLFG